MLTSVSPSTNSFLNKFLFFKLNAWWLSWVFFICLEEREITLSELVSFCFDGFDRFFYVRRDRDRWQHCIVLRHCLVNNTLCRNVNLKGGITFSYSPANRQFTSVADIPRHFGSANPLDRKSNKWQFEFDFRNCCMVNNLFA